MSKKPTKEDQWDMLTTGIGKLAIKGDSINVIIEDRVYKVEYLYEKDKVLLLK